MIDVRQYLISFMANIKGHQAVSSGLQRMEASQKTLGKETAKGTKRTQSFNDMLNKAAKRALIVAPVWMALRSVMMAFIQLIKGSFQFLIDWEYQMAQIRIVAKGTKEEYEKLSASLLKLASRYGASFKQIGEGAKLWAQQGKTATEIIYLMDTTMRASLITGRSMGNTVEDLTAVMKNYNIEAMDSIKIIDAVTEVMLHHAITTEVLIGAIRDVAPVATQFNISFEKMLGIITATHIATRAKGQRIGKAWRTILSRMATTAREKIQKIAGVGMYLDEFGKVTTKATVDIRNLGDALDEIAIVFDQLKPKQKAQLGYAMAGRRRLELLAASLANYREGIKAEIEALTSWGASEKASIILLDTARKKIDRASASWRELVDTLMGTEATKGAFDALIGVISSFESGIATLSWRLAELWETREIRKTTAELRKRYDTEIAKGKGLLTIYDKLSRYKEITAKYKVERLTEEEIKAMINWEAFEEAFKMYGVPTEVLREGIDKTLDYLQNRVEELPGIIRRTELEKEFALKVEDMKQELVDLRLTLQSVMKERPAFWQLGRTLNWIYELEKKFDNIKNIQKEIRTKEEEYNKLLANRGKFIELNLKKEKEITESLAERLGKMLVAEATWKAQLKHISRGKDLGKTALEIAKEKLDYLRDETKEYENLGDQVEKNLEIDIEHLEIVKQYNFLKQKANILEEARFSLMKARGAEEFEILWAKKSQLISDIASENKDKDRLALIKSRVREATNFLQLKNKELQTATDLYRQYAKADEAGKKQIERLMKLVKMRPDELARAVRDPFDFSVIDRFWRYFTEKQKQAMWTGMEREYPALEEFGSAEMWERRREAYERFQEARWKWIRKFPPKGKPPKLEDFLDPTKGLDTSELAIQKISDEIAELTRRETTAQRVARERLAEEFTVRWKEEKKVIVEFGEMTFKLSGDTLNQIMENWWKEKATEIAEDPEFRKALGKDLSNDIT